MSTIDKRWLAEFDLFLQGFAARAAIWDQTPGDYELGLGPWTDPDHPNARLDAAYRAGIVPPEARRSSRPSPPPSLRYARRQA